MVTQLTSESQYAILIKLIVVCQLIILSNNFGPPWCLIVIRLHSLIQEYFNCCLWAAHKKIVLCVISHVGVVGIGQ